MIGKYAYSVEVPITNFTTQGQNKFNDLASNSLLNPASTPGVTPVVQGIESFYASLYSFSPSNRPVVSQADAASLAVTFNSENTEPLYQTPYLDFATVLNYGKIKEIEPTALNLQKSYVLVQQTIAAGQSTIFNFWFDRFTDKEWTELKAHIKAQKLKYGHYEK
jgi:hypothetical protein